MQKFWNWIHDDSGGRVLRLEGPIDAESFWGDEITPQDFRDELYAEDGDICTVSPAMATALAADAAMLAIFTVTLCG